MSRTTAALSATDSRAMQVAKVIVHCQLSPCLFFSNDYFRVGSLQNVGKSAALKVPKVNTGYLLALVMAVQSIDCSLALLQECNVGMEWRW